MGCIRACIFYRPLTVDGNDGVECVRLSEGRLGDRECDSERMFLCQINE